MEVKGIKLFSGEEIVGEVTFEDENEILLKNPLIVMMQRTPDGDVGIGFVPFAPYLPKGHPIPFKTAATVYALEVDDNMKNNYSKAFGGIVTPPKKLILG